MSGCFSQCFKVTPVEETPAQTQLQTTPVDHKLEPNVQSIQLTCDFIKRNGLTEVDRSNGTSIINAISIMKQLPKGLKKTILPLFQCLRMNGATDDSSVCNAICIAALKSKIYLSPRWYKGGFHTIREGDDNALNQMMNNCTYMNEKRTISILYAIERRTSDRYLNTPIIDLDGKMMTPLKSAVVHNRIHIVTTIMRRFPAVNFDLIHPELNLAEPLRLSIRGSYQQKRDMENVLLLGESMVTNYHTNLNIFVTMVLNNVMIPELMSIILSYLARRTVSSIPLLLPLKRMK